MGAATARQVDELAAVELLPQLVDLSRESSEIAVPRRRALGSLVLNELQKLPGLKCQNEDRTGLAGPRDLPHPVEIDFGRQVREHGVRHHDVEIPIGKRQSPERL